MTDPRKDGMVPDPSQLAEMQATDARLDRLGRRDPHADDLADPLFGALAGLADEVDVADPQQQGVAVAKLMEVLDGRPLWVLDGEELSDLDAAKNMILLDDPTWDARRRQVIDLRRDDSGDAEDEPAADGTAADGTAAEIARADETQDADDTPDATEVAATAGTGAETAESAEAAATSDETDDAAETDETAVAASVAATAETPVAARAGTVTPLRGRVPRARTARSRGCGRCGACRCRPRPRSRCSRSAAVSRPP